MLLKKRRGQALVEFALVLPILLSLLVGIVDIGFLYNHQLTLTNAAREGARMGTLGHDEAEVLDDIEAYLTASAYSPMPAAGDIDVTIANGQVTVDIESQVPWLFAMSGAPITLSATTRMRHE